MILVAAGGPNYELSLLNLETGNIEYLMCSEELQGEQDLTNTSLQSGLTISSYYRESLIRDQFNWPEKQETN
jgi:hypothetical protein